MIRVQQLRQKAERLRRVASVATQDDALITRDLSALADQFEEKAAAREEYLKRQSRGRLLGRV